MDFYQRVLKVKELTKTPFDIEVQFPQEVHVNGIFIGTKLMEAVKWEICDPAARFLFFFFENSLA